MHAALIRRRRPALDPTQVANDRYEIVDALHRFAAGQDLRDRELLASAFTLDATLAIPTAGTASTDWAQPNSQSAPYDLRTISGSQTFTGLSINSPGGADWFEFHMDNPGEDGQFVEIDFDKSAGDLDLALYNSNAPSAQPIKVSPGTADFERISLADQPAGEYYIKISSYAGATNDEIAEAAGVSASVYFRHFRTKGELFREALDRRTKVLGEDHPDTLTSLNTLGSFHFWRREFADAERYYLRALESRRRTLGRARGATHAPARCA